MATVRLSPRAFAHLEQIFEFIAASEPKRAAATIERLRDGIKILGRHPLLGRVVENGRRELVLSRGRYAHLALYRWIPAEDLVLVLTIRDARQAGYLPD